MKIIQITMIATGKVLKEIDITPISDEEGYGLKYKIDRALDSNKFYSQILYNDKKGNNEIQLQKIVCRH